VQIFERFTSGVVDMGGKFGICINDASGQFATCVIAL
jgi:hypothetical protein